LLLLSGRCCDSLAQCPGIEAARLRVTLKIVACRTGELRRELLHQSRENRATSANSTPATTTPAKTGWRKFVSG
jgi:hypothetical protein